MAYGLKASSCDPLKKKNMKCIPFGIRFLALGSLGGSEADRLGTCDGRSGGGGCDGRGGRRRTGCCDSFLFPNSCFPESGK